MITAEAGDRKVKVMLQSGTEVTHHFDQIQRCPDEVPRTTEASVVEQDTPVTGTESNSIQNNVVPGAALIQGRKQFPLRQELLKPVLQFQSLYLWKYHAHHQK